MGENLFGNRNDILMKKYIRFYFLFLILIFALSIFIINLGNRFSKEIDEKMRNITTSVINGNINSEEVYVKYNSDIIVKNISVYRKSGEILSIPSMEISINWIKSIIFRRMFVRNIKFIQPDMKLFMEGNRLNIVNLFTKKNGEISNAANDTIASNSGFKSGVDILIDKMEIKNGKLSLVINNFRKKYDNINISVNMKVEKDNLILNLKKFKVNSDSLRVRADKGKLEISKSDMRITDITLKSNKVDLNFIGDVDLNKSIFNFTSWGEGDLSFVNYFIPNPIPLQGKCSFSLKGKVYNGKYRIEGKVVSNYTDYDIYGFTGLRGNLLIANDTLSFHNLVGYYKHSKISARGYFAFNNPEFFCNIHSDSLFLSDIYSKGSTGRNRLNLTITYKDNKKTTYLSGSLTPSKYRKLFKLSMSISTDSLSIDTFLISDSSLHVLSSGYYLYKRNYVNLNLKLNDFNLETVGYLVGDSMIGEISGLFNIEGNLKNPNISSDLNFRKLKYKEYSANYINIKGNINSLFRLPKGNLHINGTNVAMNGKNIDIFNIDGKEVKNIFFIDGSLKSDMGKLDFLCDLLIQSKDRGVIGIDSLSGKIFDSGFFATNKVRINYSEDSITVRGIGINLLTGGEIKGNLVMIHNALKGILKVSQLDLIAMRRIIPEYDISGITDMEINFDGWYRYPEIAVKVNSDSLSLNKVPLTKFMCDFNYTKNKIILDNLHFYIKNNYSWLKGFIDFKSIPYGKLQFSLNDIPFNLIPNNDFLELNSGFINLKGSVNGTVKNPNFDFAGNADNISFKIPNYGIDIKKMIFNIMGKGSEVIVSNILAGTKNYGYFKGNGIISYSNGELKNYKLNAEINDFNIRYYDLLNGTISGTAFINGNRTMVDINSNLNIYNTDISISFREPPVFSGGNGGGKSNFTTNFNVSITTGNNVWFRNEDMEVEIGGNVNVRNYGKNIFINGTVSTRRGFYYYLDRAFNIKEGTIQFTNTSDFNPLLSIRSETKISHMNRENEHYEREDITVHLDATGNAKNPEISLYSTPPKSIISILSLLNVNLTPDELTKFNVLGASISEKILNYYIRTKIINNIQKKLGIDIFDIETSLLSQNKYARINVGKYLANNFFVSYSHDIFSQSQDEFRIDYYFKNGINLFGERDYTGKFNFGVGLIYRY
ncbi:hypothetical protein DRP44_01990 [candidate division TA06 bacterium]|uniref:Translocation and assembly module TamB C-terminal domain-containing protein n=1 Tax=candidate division TA06 bacterium TaxID=2250710 RepID=A0A660S9V3_UNCT6|nr:MAG: hypothetical protein DRP44_01990 [candidate division TA06 bacterium]